MAYVQIPDELCLRIEAAVADGQYSSFDDAVSGVLSDVFAGDHTLTDEDLQAAADVGIADVNAKRFSVYSADEIGLNQMWQHFSR